MSRILQSRAKEADDIVRALAAIAPCIEAAEGFDTCGVCGCAVCFYEPEKGHRSECPWLRAREYVAEKGSGK